MKLDTLKEQIADESVQFVKWPWTDFKPEEVACKCEACGHEMWKPELDEECSQPAPRFPKYFIYSMGCLQMLRHMWGKPIVINSGHRCQAHNAEVDGVAKSQHLEKIAFDCVCAKEDQDKFVQMAKQAGFAVARPYPDKGFVHLDNGPVRTW